MQAFENRLVKVYRHISKWAKRQQISCYRIYDMDIPEFPLCIDRYEDHLHVAEYKTRFSMSEEEHVAWLAACKSVMAKVTGVASEHIWMKERKRLSRRSEQYEKLEEAGQRIIVQEGGLQFYVNLRDYLDTGLFLDHRPLRSVFREEAAGKHVLNLFAYTGSFSVYAAAGNAASVTTVDLSGTYLRWAQDNFDLNHLTDPQQHHFIQSDVMDFLKKQPLNQFDLVFADPPAFSNSKRMSGTWDTQRDHAAMLHFLYPCVKPGGVVYFSNNLRNFQPDWKKWEYASAKDITVSTIPEDFRNKRIHHCYRLIK